jgi:hypothetical protein
MPVLISENSDPKIRHRSSSILPAQSWHGISTCYKPKPLESPIQKDYGRISTMTASLLHEAATL